MWTPEESDRIQAIARETKPGIKTMALPQGLQVQHGPDAVVEYIIKILPALIES
jgi:5-enolpyruvylshikimate-3-phosphate synthase